MRGLALSHYDMGASPSTPPIHPAEAPTRSSVGVPLCTLGDAGTILRPPSPQRPWEQTHTGFAFHPRVGEDANASHYVVAVPGPAADSRGKCVTCVLQPGGGA